MCAVSTCFWCARPRIITLRYKTRRQFKALGRSFGILICGALTVFAFAPFSVWPVAIISLAALFAAVSQMSFQESLYYGWLYGAGLFFAGVHWTFYPIGVYGTGGIMGGVTLTLLFGIFMGLFPAIAIALTTAWKRYPLLRLLVVLPVMWCLVEWSRTWLFTGFPWLIYGYSLIDSPAAALAPAGGVLAASLLLSFSAAAVAAIWVVASRWKWLFVLVVVIVWGGLYTQDRLMWTSPLGDALMAAIVQGNIAQENKWKPSYRQLTLDRYREMSEPVWEQSDFIVWPETAVPDFLHYVGESYLLPLKERAWAEEKTLILGIPVYDHTGPSYYNAVLALGEEPGLYRKRHLVPFGEYLPFRNLLGDKLDFLGTPHGDFSSGADTQKPLIVQGYPVATSVCFEIVFGDEIRRDAAQAAWLINVSNDGWFGGSIAPHQHMQIARMRALETNRDLVRSTNTGISAVIGADGRVKKRTPQFEQLALIEKVQPRQGMTPYVKWGDMPFLVITLVLLSLAGLAAIIVRPRNIMDFV